MVPTEITAGELAGILGVSERRIAALKAEGRIPTAGNGKILLHDLLYRQHAELARVRQQPHMASVLAKGKSWDELHPIDAIARIVANVLAGLMPAAAVQAALSVGVSVEQAKALHAVMLVEAAKAREAAKGMCTIEQDPDGPEPGEVLDLKPVDWDALAA
ncbi:hypothetical protein BKE38_28775 [Pseudoroseomonas deserti]|uniref:Uncharacterized protein n=1 Tax=Teichococcus deserti TaxID=1817963 RepID=A0A1V2GUW5_9PROT|nr:hypothetical protein [Pseudoroseomonas deserti]ONG43591.1 hypothetical protein BKE38_28775 [Pseudoroseomonas deserti]